MRIRKNAKFSQLSTLSTSSPSSNSLTKTHLNCQLNQSPWDIITFPLPNSSDHFQVDEQFWCAGNGSFGDSIGAIHSPLENEEVLNNDRKYDIRSDDSSIGFDELEKEETIVKEEEKDEDVVLCCETDGKGWQCGRIVKKNENTHKMCAIHLKSCKKSDGVQLKRGRGRPPSKKKKPTPASAGAEENPNEYYYYSGFGPLWGKKKGPGRKSNDDVTSMSKSEDGNTKILAPEIDYMECDEDDDEEDGGGEIEKKRGRKRIKARSLKSLM